MVTVTVIMVLVGAGSMSLNTLKGIKELESIREIVSNHLKVARNLAITKQLPDKSFNLEYVRVSFSGNNIAIEGVDDSGIVHTSHPYLITSIKTNSGISINSRGNFSFIKSTGRLADASGNSVGTTMTVEISREANVKIISISNLGVVSNVN